MEQNAVELQEQFRTKCLKEAGITYSIAAVLPVLLSFIVALPLAAAGFSAEEEYPDWYLYMMYILPQVCFAVAAAVYILRTKEPLKNVYCGCKFKYFPIAILLQFGLLFSLSSLNNIFIAFLELLGYTAAETPVPSLEGWNLLPAVFAIAVLPAIFEETVFRGILSRTMHARGWGLVPTCLIAGAMFSLFHGNPEQTVYQFICGACFTLVAIRAGSILPTMIAHFLNNAAILVLTAFGFDTMPDFAATVIFYSSLICLVGTLIYLTVYDKNGNQRGGLKAGKIFLLAAAVGLAVCAFEWIFGLITGFIHV